MLTPVVLIIFNRPHLTEQVFPRIKAAQPRQLFVIADGPRSDMPADIETCRLARQITETIDWDCDVQCNYAETNLGCRERVTSGLDWVFSQVDRAIILEDDCVPDPTFFPFCQHLLQRYSHDERVAAITGNNFQDGQWRGQGSYYFSKYFHCWGWATWRRAWQAMDLSNRFCTQALRSSALDAIWDSPQEQYYWTTTFHTALNSSNVSSWAYPWLLNCWVNHQMTIIPNHNLVTNLGFMPDSTHTTSDHAASSLASQPLNVLNHPLKMDREQVADQYTFKTYYIGPNYRLKSILKSVIKTVKSALT